MTNQPNTQGNEPARDDLVERIARRMLVTFGYKADADWEGIWIGNQADDEETGSLAYLCRQLASAAIETLRTTSETNSEDAFVAGHDAGAKAMQDAAGSECSMRLCWDAFDAIRKLDPTALRPSHMEGGK